jgi:hypothetical protein
MDDTRRSVRTSNGEAWILRVHYPNRKSAHFLARRKAIRAMEFYLVLGLMLIASVIAAWFFLLRRG